MFYDEDIAKGEIEYSHQHSMDCPYCQSVMYADFVDVEVGFIQVGPYYCEACGSCEIHFPTYYLKANFDCNIISASCSTFSREEGFIGPMPLKNPCISYGSVEVSGAKYSINEENGKRRYSEEVVKNLKYYKKNFKEIELTTGFYLPSTEKDFTNINTIDGRIVSHRDIYNKLRYGGVVDDNVSKEEVVK